MNLSLGGARPIWVGVAALLLAFIASLPTLCGAADLSSGRVAISAGKFTPLYGVEGSTESVDIQEFWIDVHPVTNQDFYRFVRQHPEWGPGNAPPLLVDERYLMHWGGRSGSLAPRKQELSSPVVNISWFAADAYCREMDGHLPTVFQWEYVGAASEKSRDASHDPQFVQKLLDWYAVPHDKGVLPAVTLGLPNYWGVYDMHGLVWEWVYDFNSIFVGGDNRRDGEQLKNLVCGAGAASANDRANYAAFMRYALRNSLQGRFGLGTLGFRCAYDKEKHGKE